ncbi:MAG TPA: LytTR family DNA-binding domain-containing protein [Gemmatimonadaceae bacterium]|jgi:two-component system LytT family response regulator|nr:LytTR family DNA-binding domain-containing protein [Gemmatimonadaceae bacterium]
MTPRCRVLVVDDEAPARRLARSLLAEMDEVEVIGDAARGQTAVDAIRQLRPDIVLLDVQMPGLDGFGVVAAVGVSNMPAVIFVTAYERYALKAFEVHAVDYLLKPFDHGRFRTAMERAIVRVRSGRSSELSGRLEMLLNRLARDRSPDRITLKVDHRHILIDAATIDCIEVSDKVVLVQTAEQIYRVRETLNRIERRLPSEQFVRIHRSVIVNIKRVKEIQTWFQGDYVLILNNGKRVMSGRAYRDVVRRFTARSD